MRLRAKRTLFALALVGAGIGVLGTARPASALEPEPGAYYEFSINSACRWQYPGATGASLWQWSPYAWYCYQVNFPPGFTPLGGLNLNGYCAAAFPGTRAVLQDNGPYGWRCQKPVSSFVRYYIATATATLRSGPGSNYASLGVIRQGTPVDVVCQSRGTSYDGSTMWNGLTGGQWVHDALTNSPVYNNLSPPNRWC